MTHAITTPAAAPVTMGFNDLASFEFLQRSAKAFTGSTMVPAAYQAMTTKGYGARATTEHNPAALSNCMIALDMAHRMDANPLMVMQNLHVIEGRPSWSSQFIIAAINSCGKFSPLRFDLEWLDDIDASHSTYEWVNGNKTEKKQVVRIKNARCVAWAIEKATGQRLESAPVTLEMAVNEGWYSKNGSKWRSMPDLMLRYRSAAFFGRIYAPELLMGLPTAEETQDVFVQDDEGHMVYAGAQTVPTSTGPVEVVEPEDWPDDKWAARLPAILTGIAQGKSIEDALAWLNSKGRVTPTQEAQLRSEVAKLQPTAETPSTPVADTPATDTPATDTPSAADTLVQSIQACTTRDQLYALGEYLDGITEDAAQQRATDAFTARVAELEQAA
jgi:hypothetical protein